MREQTEAEKQPIIKLKQQRSLLRPPARIKKNMKHHPSPTTGNAVCAWCWAISPKDESFVSKHVSGTLCIKCTELAIKVKKDYIAQSELDRFNKRVMAEDNGKTKE